MIVRPGPKLAILIVDDLPLFRLALKQVLHQDFRDTAFGEAETVAEALAKIRATPWRLVILGVGRADDDDSFSVLRYVCANCPQTAVLVLGLQPDSPDAARSLHFGASGYTAKTSSRSDIVKAVSNVLKGRMHFSKSVRLAISHQAFSGLHASLSAQEYKVLLSLATGSRIVEIAAGLNLSAKTVSTYRRRVLNKLGLESTADLVRYVIDHKLS